MLDNCEQLVSIIVPIYNSFKTLPRCIESLLGQTYKKIELILVDDGSIDHSLEIAEEYLKRDSRVFLFRENHSGVSHARNVGIRMATGQKIMFCDSDDYFDIQMVEKMLTTMENKKSSVCVCGVTIEGAEEGKFPAEPFSVEIDFHEMYDELLSGTYVKCWVSNKMYNKECFRDILFDEKLSMYEDIDFQLRFFSRPKATGKCVFIEDYLYHYVLRSDSLSRSNEQITNSCEYIIQNTLKAIPRTNNWKIRKCKLYIYEIMAIWQCENKPLCSFFILLRNSLFLLYSWRVAKHIVID